MKTRKKKKIISSVLALFIVLGIGAFNYLTDQGPDDSCLVTRVVDGDTIVVSLEGKEEKVRLIGIDTPESVHPDQTKNVPYGKVVSEFTKEELLNETVQLEFDVEERDRYGRLLAYVYQGDTMFNLTLVEKGYAKVATFPPNVKYVDSFTEAQREARQAEKGMWEE